MRDFGIARFLRRKRRLSKCIFLIGGTVLILQIENIMLAICNIDPITALLSAGILGLTVLLWFILHRWIDMNLGKR
jgi:hypothetical protein